MTGISNGGYLTRWQLENHPELYDGGVDWEGTLMRPDGPNLFTYLPAALATTRPGSAATRPRTRRSSRAGFAPGSEQLWDDHYAEYWDLTQRTYREEFDPGYDGPLEAGNPFCQPGTPACDADYDYASRPQAVKDAVGRVSLTGRIGKPMLTLHGTLDALLPIRTDSDVYTRMIRDAGRGAPAPLLRDRGRQPRRLALRPLPRRAAPDPALLPHRVRRLRGDGSSAAQAPPPSQTVARTAGGDVANALPAAAGPARRRAAPGARPSRGCACA